LIDLGHEPYSVASAEVLTLGGWFAPDVPIVMQTNQNIHHHYPPPFSWLEQRAFRRVAAAYGCSETVCEVLRAKGFRKPAPVIPFGVNTESFRPKPPANARSEGPFTIGFVGRLLPGKGLNVLAGALEKLKAETWRLLVVGDGPEREQFEQRLTAVGLSDRAVFTGAVNYDLVPAHFQQMDMLVLPTETTKRIREQFGRVLVEAMASGVPVVQPRRGEPSGGEPAGQVETGATMIYKPKTPQATEAVDAGELGVEREVAVLTWDGQTKRVDKRRIVLGRSRECDIQVEDPNVSRRHAELRQEGASYWVVDLESTNGIEVNGHRVQRAKLDSGDTFTVGSTEITFTTERE